MNKSISMYADAVFHNGSVITVDKSDNSVDLFIQNEVKRNDLVLTQDYGVALISLFKGAKTINQYGYFYKDENIDYLMEIKNINRKNKKLKGPKKRSIEDKERLLNVVEKVIKEW